jgi:hypothetical protein
MKRRKRKKKREKRERRKKRKRKKRGEKRKRRERRMLRVRTLRNAVTPRKVLRMKLPEGGAGPTPLKLRGSSQACHEAALLRRNPARSLP